MKNKINEWKEDLRIKKIIIKTMEEALTFSKKQSISEKDLVRVLNSIKKHKKKIVKAEEIRKKLNYAIKDFKDILIRLMMLGEIYDPYVGISREKESKFVKVMG